MSHILSNTEISSLSPQDISLQYIYDDEKLLQKFILSTHGEILYSLEKEGVILDFQKIIQLGNPLAFDFLMQKDEMSVIASFFLPLYENPLLNIFNHYKEANDSFALSKYASSLARNMDKFYSSSLSNSTAFSTSNNFFQIPLKIYNFWKFIQLYLENIHAPSQKDNYVSKDLVSNELLFILGDIPSRLTVPDNLIITPEHLHNLFIFHTNFSKFEQLFLESHTSDSDILFFKEYKTVYTQYKQSHLFYFLELIFTNYYDSNLNLSQFPENFQYALTNLQHMAQPYIKKNYEPNHILDRAFKFKNFSMNEYKQKVDQDNAFLAKYKYKALSIKDLNELKKYISNKIPIFIPEAHLYPQTYSNARINLRSPLTQEHLDIGFFQYFLQLYHSNFSDFFDFFSITHYSRKKSLEYFDNITEFQQMFMNNEFIFIPHNSLEYISLPLNTKIVNFFKEHKLDTKHFLFNTIIAKNLLSLNSEMVKHQYDFDDLDISNLNLFVEYHLLPSEFLLKEVKLLPSQIHLYKLLTDNIPIERLHTLLYKEARIPSYSIANMDYINDERHDLYCNFVETKLRNLLDTKPFDGFLYFQKILCSDAIFSYHTSDLDYKLNSNKSFENCLTHDFIKKYPLFSLKFLLFNQEIYSSNFQLKFLTLFESLFELIESKVVNNTNNKSYVFDIAHLIFNISQKFFDNHFSPEQNSFILIKINKFLAVKTQTPANLSYLQLNSFFSPFDAIHTSQISIENRYDKLLLSLSQLNLFKTSYKTLEHTHVDISNLVLILKPIFNIFDNDIIMQDMKGINNQKCLVILLSCYLTQFSRLLDNSNDAHHINTKQYNLSFFFWDTIINTPYGFQTEDTRYSPEKDIFSKHLLQLNNLIRSLSLQKDLVLSPTKKDISVINTLSRPKI